jgi:hypothetical protein
MLRSRAAVRVSTHSLSVSPIEIKMSLRNRVRLIVLIPIALWVVVSVWLVPSDRFGSGLTILSTTLAIFVGLLLANVVSRRYLNRFRQAVAREDVPTARRLLEGLTDFCRWRGREVIKSYGISILISEERYQEALDGFHARREKNWRKGKRSYKESNRVVHSTIG